MIRRWWDEVRDYVTSPRGVPDRVSESIRDEISFHLTETAAQQVEQGVPVDEACRSAVARFGDVDGVVRACARDAVEVHSRWHRRHLALTAVLVIGAAMLGAWSYRALNAPPWIGDGDLVGQVIDELGKPVAGAHVLAVVKTWPQQAYRQLAYTAITGDDGMYRIDNVYPLDEKYAVQIAVHRSARRRARSGRLQAAEHNAAGGSVRIVGRAADGGGPRLPLVEDRRQRREALGLLLQRRADR